MRRRSILGAATIGLLACFAGTAAARPLELRIRNDTQVVPDHPAEASEDDPQAKKPDTQQGGAPSEKRFSQRQLVECLRRGAESFGWSAQEATTRPFMEMVHPDDRADVARQMQGLAEGTPLVGYETRVLHKDGSYRWIENRSWPHQSGERRFVVSIGRDIQAQQAGPHAIIDVVGVIGDVVGDRAGLRLRTGKSGEGKVLAGAIFGDLFCNPPLRVAAGRSEQRSSESGLRLLLGGASSGCVADVLQMFIC